MARTQYGLASERLGMTGTRQFGGSFFPAVCYGIAALMLVLFYYRHPGANAPTDSVYGYVLFGINCFFSARIAISDARTLKIPFLHLGVIGLTAIFVAAISQTLLPSFLAAASAAITLLTARQLTTYVTGKPSIGIGDIMLSFCLGFWLTPATLPFALIVAITVTALFRLILDFRLGSRIPFAPGIALGFCLVAAIG